VRVTVWGTLGGLGVPPIFGLLGFFTTGTTLVEVLGAMAATAMLGGLSAPATVAVARRGELPPPGERAAIASGDVKSGSFGPSTSVGQ
jgi:hypothetical protein